MRRHTVYAFSTASLLAMLLGCEEDRANVVGAPPGPEGNETPADGGTAGQDPGAPAELAIVSPGPGTVVQGDLTIQAQAMPGLHVQSVQFLIDNQPVQVPDTEPPYETVIDQLALGTGIHEVSAMARDASGRTVQAEPVPVEVRMKSSPEHPRIWLDLRTREQLRTRALQPADDWLRLRANCEGYLRAQVEWPDGFAYPEPGNLGPGYRGDGYFDALLELGLCYVVGQSIDDALAPAFAAKGAEILDRMSQPPGAPHYEAPRDGYGIRYYGIGLAIGYDWLHATLTPELRVKVLAAINHWLAAYAISGLGPKEPQGNFFAGYYAAMAYAALATEGENPSKPTLWKDWYEGMHKALVQPYYQSWLRGGGWPEGWHYGYYALNMQLPVLAVRTAKGIDLLRDPSHPYSYPLDQSPHLIHFTWPSRERLDDRGTIRRPDSTRVSPQMMTVQAGLAHRWADPYAHVLQRFARLVREQRGPAMAWQDLLFWREDAPEAGIESLPLSYATAGMGEVAMRSDWSTSAVWGSFRSGPYINSIASGEQYFDQGALAIVRGGQPLLINVTGIAVVPYPPSTYATEYDLYLNSHADNQAPRDVFNIFYNGAGQIMAGPDVSQTRLTRVHDDEAYVQMRGERLEQMYGPEAHIRAWTRDVVYVRPQLFVVYDRTQVGQDQGQHTNWHFLSSPIQVPSSQGTRFDVVHPHLGYLGSMTALLPARHTVQLVNVFNSDKMYRVEVYPVASEFEQTWLTVLEASPGPQQVADVSLLEAGAAEGVLLRAGPGNTVVLFAGEKKAPIDYQVPAGPTEHVVTGLEPGLGYSVQVQPAGDSVRVQLRLGSEAPATDGGTLRFQTE